MGEAAVLGERRLAPYYFAYYAYLGAFGTYFPLWLAAQAYSSSEIAFVLVLPQLLRTIVPFAWGRVVARAGAARTIVAIATLVAAGVCISFRFAGNLGETMALAGVMGILTSSLLPSVEATTQLALAGRPGRYGRVRLWGSMGSIAATLAVGFVLDRAAIGTLVPIIAGVMAIAAVFAFALPAVPLGRPTAGPRDRFAPAGATTFLAACACMMLAHGALFSFYALHLSEHGLSRATIGGLVTLGVLAEVLAFGRLGWLFERASHRTVMIGCLALACVRFALIGWGAGSLPLLMIAQLLHAATFAAFHGAAMAELARMYPGTHQVRGQALYGGLVYGLGGVGGGLAAGWARDLVVPEAAFGASVGFAAVGLAILLARGRR